MSKKPPRDGDQDQGKPSKQTTRHGTRYGKPVERDPIPDVKFVWDNRHPEQTTQIKIQADHDWRTKLLLAVLFNVLAITILVWDRLDTEFDSKVCGVPFSFYLMGISILAVAGWRFTKSLINGIGKPR